MKASRFFTLFSLVALLSFALPHLNAAEESDKAYQGQRLVFEFLEDEADNWEIYAQFYEEGIFFQGWEHKEDDNQFITLETHSQDPQNPMTLDEWFTTFLSDLDDVEMIASSENEMLFKLEHQGEECYEFLCAKMIVTPQAFHALAYCALDMEPDQEKWISFLSNAKLED